MAVVLLLTTSDDHYTVQRVAAAVSLRGLRAVRLDTDLFPAQVTIRGTLDQGDTRVRFIVPEGEVDAGEVSAVWLRRIRAPRLSPSLDPRFQQMCRGETLAAWRGLCDALAHARWVNDLGRGQAAENKLMQLRMAAACGLQVPPTLLTNDPHAARAFHAQHGGAVVTKLLGAAAGPDGTRVYTAAVSAEDLGNADASFRHAPVLLQRRIEKARELRVICVAGRTWCASLDASASQRGTGDWRRATTAECAWQPDAIPAGVHNGITALMGRLGLVFGAIDIIRTPASEHVFLEINPAGEWGMLERDLGFPIAEAIAEALTAPSDASARP